MSSEQSKQSFPSAKPAVWIAALCTVLVVGISFAMLLVKPTIAVADADIVVYKTRSCGCCGKWIDHLRDNGFSVAVKNVPHTRAIQQKLGVPPDLGSCHTAVAGDHWVEGHVPADVVHKLVTDRPEEVLGVSVPGMPIGSPGMEGPNPQSYNVYAYGKDGEAWVYATRQGKAPQ